MSKETEETAVIPVSMGDRGVALHNIDEAWRFAEAIERSGIAPKGMESQPKIFAVVVAGSELGLTPFRSLSNMKIINGRVGPMGALAKALVRREKVLAPGTGFKQDFIGQKGTDEYAARITTLRVGEREPYVTTFSVADAKLAGLWGRVGRDGKPSVWMKYPDRMLTWRAVGFHMDDYYSDVLMGMHIAEVLEDYPEIRLPQVMKQLAEPVKDPLLDDLDAKHAAEMEAVGATMQPPRTATVLENKVREPFEIEDPEKVDQETGEYVENLFEVGPREEPSQPSSLAADDPASARLTATEVRARVSPLEATMAEKAAEAPPMTEEEAMGDLIREGTVKEEDLATADPSNKAEEGADREDLF